MKPLCEEFVMGDNYNTVIHVQVLDFQQNNPTPFLKQEQIIEFSAYMTKNMELHRWTSKITSFYSGIQKEN